MIRVPHSCQAVVGLVL